MDTQEIAERPSNIILEFGCLLWRFFNFLLGFLAFAVGSLLEEIIRHPDLESDLETAEKKKEIGADELNTVASAASLSPSVASSVSYSSPVIARVSVSGPFNQSTEPILSVSTLGTNEEEAKAMEPKTSPVPPASLRSPSPPAQQPAANSGANHVSALSATSAPFISRSLSEPGPKGTSVSDNVTPSADSGADESKGLVLKNLPWTIKYDDLHNLLHSYEFKPRSVRYVRNEKGRFSGIVMVKYNSADEAKHMQPIFEGLEVGGRTVSVEYKQSARKHKKMKEARRSSVSQPVSPSGSTEQTPASSLTASRESSPPSTPATLSPPHSPEVTPQHSPKQARKEQVPPPSAGPSLSTSAPAGPALLPTPSEPLPFFRPKSYSISYPPSWATSSYSSTLCSYPLSAHPQPPLPDHTPAAPSYAQSAVRRRLSVNDTDRATFVPSRQPIGPEQGAKGFSEQYRKSRAAGTEAH